jgi:adenylate kinase family enzyme
MLTDGFPRSLAQMYYFLTREAKHQREFMWVHFYLSKEKAIERLLQRAKEQWRKDDTRESIGKRIEVFEQETLPVIRYFEQIGKLIVIDADKPLEIVYKEFLEQLNKFDCI